MPATVELTRRDNVELIRTGTWRISTGEWTASRQDLIAAVAALSCPSVRKPALFIGHTDGRFTPRDGEPTIGWVDNLRLTDGGHTLLGDYVGVPAWLNDVMASAYPDRSVEGVYGHRCQIGHTHPFVLTGVALLGVTPPGVGTLQSLNTLDDVRALYGLAASVPVVGTRVAAHLPGKHDQSSHAGKRGSRKPSTTGTRSAPATKTTRPAPIGGGNGGGNQPGSTPVKQADPDGGPASRAGRAAFLEAEPAASVEQVVAVMQRHRKANPQVSTKELIAAADAAIEAKYPGHPQIKGFYSKLLKDRLADIDEPPAATKPAKPPPEPPAPKKAPAAQDHPTLTAKQAQALQDRMPPPWTGGQRNGLRYYTGNSAVANGLLRGWIRPPGRTAEERRKIEAAQRNIGPAMEAMRPAPQALTVFRATNAEQFNVATLAELDNLVGHDLTDEGFMSTTTAKSFHLQGKVKMEIELPEGAPMAFVKSVSKYPYEDEVLLPPGTRFQVLSVRQGRGWATVRVRVVL